MAETHEKLTDTTTTIVNLARARQNAAATNGTSDKTLTGVMDALLFTNLSTGFDDAMELLQVEGGVTLDDSEALAQFFAVRKDVLDIITPPDGDDSGC